MEALWSLFDSSKSGDRGVFNVVDNEPARKQEIVDWLARRLDRPGIHFDPEKQTTRASGRRTRAGMPNRRVSNRKLRECTNWSPRYPTFREGYEQILNSIQDSSFQVRSME